MCDKVLGLDYINNHVIDLIVLEKKNKKSTKNNKLLHVVYHPRADSSPPQTEQQGDNIKRLSCAICTAFIPITSQKKINSPPLIPAHGSSCPHPPSSRCIPRIETFFRITQWDRFLGHGGKSRAREE